MLKIEVEERGISTKGVEKPNEKPTEGGGGGGGRGGGGCCCVACCTSCSNNE